MEVYGNLINRIKENVPSVPEVGKGATVYMYTDRGAYFVDGVSDDGKTVVIERACPIWEKPFTGYAKGYKRYPPQSDSSNPIILRYRYGAWRRLEINAANEVFYPGMPTKIRFGEMSEYYCQEI